MTDLPDPHKRALVWLRDHGGDGLIDRYGRVIAQGEKYGSGETSQVWLRLVASGHIVGHSNRLWLSLSGTLEANRLPPAPRDQDPRASHRGPLMVDDAAEDFA